MLGSGLGCCGASILVDPVAVAGFDGELWVVAELEDDGMEAGCR